MRKVTILIIIPLQLFLFQLSLGQAISPADLEEYKAQVTEDEHLEVLRNAVTANPIQKLSRNSETNPMLDEYFTYRIEPQGITDQKSSGRCWLFTGLNVLRPKVISKYGIKDFKFSQNYLFFYDQLEKANLFLNGIIETSGKPWDDREVEWLFKHPVGDGGQWTGVVDLVKKYGLVPEDVMPETAHSSSTRKMSRLLKRKLREQAYTLRTEAEQGKNAQDLQVMKKEMLGKIYQMLSLSLGEPPARFTWRYENRDGEVTAWKEYTPISFRDAFLETDLSSYVMLMDDPTREYYKLYEIEYDRHMYEGGNWKYINLPAEKIKEFALASLKEKEAMYFSCDVGKELDSDAGILDIGNYEEGALLGVEFGMDKKARIRTFDSGSTHGMALVGADTDENGKVVKWLLENSWGKKGFEGHLIMSDAWFNEYMFRLVVLKKFIDPETLQILETEPIILPPWDPMFEMDR